MPKHNLITHCPICQNLLNKNKLSTFPLYSCENCYLYEDGIGYPSFGVEQSVSTNEIRWLYLYLNDIIFTINSNNCGILTKTSGSNYDYANQVSIQPTFKPIYDLDFSKPIDFDKLYGILKTYLIFL